LAELIRREGLERRPPLETWHPTGVAEIGMKISADGAWHYQGSPITRPALVKLFAGILRREADGRHYLVTPAEKVSVEVEDAPLLAVEMWAEGSGRTQALSFRTNLDDLLQPGPAQPMRFGCDPVSGAPKPYLTVRHGLEALASRSVYLEIVDLGTVEDVGGSRQFGIWSRGVFFAMAPAGAVA
jgi:hypothetical protein